MPLKAQIKEPGALLFVFGINPHGKTREPLQRQKGLAHMLLGAYQGKKRTVFLGRSGRASGGNKLISVAERIDTQGEASGFPSTIKIASGGGLERRKLKLSTRVEALDGSKLGTHFRRNREIRSLIERNVPGQT